MTEQHVEDPLLAALRAARPAGDEELSPDSLEASALLARIVGGDQVAHDSALDRADHKGHASAVRRPLRRRWVVLGPLVASLAAVAVVLAVVLPAVHGAASVPRWVLVGDVSPVWQETPSQGLTGGLSLICPSASTCYATGLGGVQVTRDAGKTWAAVAGGPTRPSAGLSPVTCLSVSTCAVVVGSPDKGPLFMETTDAGKSWVTHPAPRWLSSMYQVAANGSAGTDGPVTLACSTAATCSFVATNISSGTVRAFFTRNGGLTWSASTLPSGLSVAGLQCFPGDQCVLAGRSAAAYSASGGRTWSSGTGYPGFEPALLSCSKASDCTVMGAVNHTSAPGSSVGVTDDGGRHWSTVDAKGLPAGVVYGLSCPTISHCWASAGGPHRLANPPAEAVPGAVIVSTIDAGVTWQRDALPRGVGNVSGVSCPSNNTCFALAWSQQSTVPQESTIVLLAYRA